jgi:hypothetical protein
LVSESTSVSTALPTKGDIEGTLLPSTVPTRVELRSARASELEEVAKLDPDTNTKIVKATYPRKARRKRTPKPPKDSRIYKAAVAYVALKAQGLKGPQIAEELGLEVTTLRQYVHIANKKGWLNIDSFADPEDKLEIVLAGKAVRNINTVLDETMVDEDSGVALVSGRASDMALEVAKGLGYLKQHQVTKGTTETQVGVALKVEVMMPINPQTGQPSSIQVRPGSVGGKPYFDAEVIGE